MFKRKKTYTDKEIVSRIKKGESRDVLLFLYESVQPKITAWIRQNDGDQDEAQDIFQDAVLSFHNYVLQDKFDAEKSVAGFIFSIGKNMWINRAKQRRRMSTELPANISDETRYSDTDESSAENVQSLLAKLGKRCEELLTLSIFYKMSMEDIALRLNFSNANAAKTKNYKCKQRLVLLVKDKSQLKQMLYSE